MPQAKSSRQGLEQTETLLQELDRLADPAARDLVQQLVQSIMQFHGDGLTRIVELLGQAGDGDSLVCSLANDELVGSLLLLYGLHPLDLETRVRQALDKVRPMLDSHGGDVHLLSVEGGLVRLRLEGSCNGCPSSSLTLKNAIEEAIYEAAADLTGLEVVGVVDESPPSGFVPLETIKVG